MKYQVERCYWTNNTMWWIILLAGFGMFNSSVQADCPSPGDIPNAIPQTFKSSYSTYESVSYFCFIGFQIKEDDNRIYCQDGGNWDTFPTCIRAPSASEWDFSIAKKPTEPPLDIELCKPNFENVEKGRTCRKSCLRPSDCVAPQKSCVCDGKCGYSCFNPEGECVELTTITNGQISYPNGMIYGNSAVYSCNEGFRLVGGSTNRTCRSDKGWSGKEPACEAIICTKPDDLINGQISPTPTEYPIGDSLRFSCGDGYKKNYQEITCGTSGWSATVACEEILCQKPEKVNNGIKVSKKDIYRMNDTVEYQCKDGYKLTGEGSVLCTKDGSWTSYPTCKKILCESSNILGDFQPDSDLKKTYSYGENVLLGCPPGFIGRANVTCNEDGLWFAISQCEASNITCESPPHVGDANNLTLSEGYPVNTKVSYTCQVGYKLVGKKAITCEETGLWSEPPKCKEIKCKYPFHVENSVEQNFNKYYSIQSEIIFECKDRYEMDGNSRLLCMDNGQWSSQEPICKKIIVPCSEPLIIGSSKDMRLKSQYFPDEIVKISCAEGMKIKGNSKIVCQDGGEWTKLPTCIIKQCGSPPDVGNANEQEFTPLYNVGKKKAYKCKDGFRIDGSPEIDCQNDETWSAPPTCNDINECTTPSVCSKHAECTNSIGSFRCECMTGFTGSGAECTDVNECDDEGTCPPDMICENTAGSYRCISKESCDKPDEILNGKFELMMQINDTRKYKYTCDDGYHLDSSLQISFRTCQNDVWQQPKSSCKRGCSFPTLPSTVIAEERKSGYPITLYIDLECAEGYEKMGSSQTKMQITCLDGFVWSKLDFDMICVRLSCGRPRDVYNGGFDGTEYLLNDVVNYHCDEGYILVGESKRVCQSDRNWNGSSPTCQKRKCQDPPIISNAKSIHEREYVFGDFIQIKCQDGYEIENNDVKNLWCLETGTWSETPKCKASSCVAPNIKKGRLLKDKHNFVVGENVDIVCEENGHKYNQFTMTCEVNSMWKSDGDCYELCERSVANDKINFYHLSYFGGVGEWYQLPINNETMLNCGWGADKSSDILRVDFEDTKMISSIEINGYDGWMYDSYVTKFSLIYRNNNKVMTFTENGFKKIFNGNTDGVNMKKIGFEYGELETNRIAIDPEDWNNWIHLFVKISVYEKCN